MPRVLMSVILTVISKKTFILFWFSVFALYVINQNVFGDYI
jgi:hypothetical protein